MQICKSRYTPGLKNAENVMLDIGETITYQLLDGQLVDAKVSSELMQHTNGAFGYECIFDDTKSLGFADWLRIIGWKGKQ